MEKIICKECGYPLNNNFNICPNCGCPISNSNDIGKNENIKSQFSNFMNNLSSTNTNKTEIKQPKAQVISTTSQKSLFSSLFRGSIGGLLLGPLGFLSGLIMGKNKHKTTFVTTGIFGNKKVVTVNNNSKKFKRLAKKM